MKLFCFGVASLVTAGGFGLFMLCPVRICSSPQGYGRWVVFQGEQVSEVLGEYWSLQQAGLQ